MPSHKAEVHDVERLALAVLRRSATRASTAAEQIRASRPRHIVPTTPKAHGTGSTYISKTAAASTHRAHIQDGTPWKKGRPMAGGALRITHEY